MKTSANVLYSTYTKGRFRVRWRSAPDGQEFQPQDKVIWDNNWYGKQDEKTNC
jgi:hypothetical protein